MPPYDIKKDFSKEACWPYITIGILFLIIVFLGSVYISSTIKSYKIRRLNDRLTEQLNNAADTNRRLAETIERCNGIVYELNESNNRDISTVREAIEIIEQTRYSITLLENELNNFDSNSYYDWCDNWLESQGISPIK